jgi:hypothetical protein
MRPHSGLLAIALAASAALPAADRAGPVISWDPTPLQPNWWLPTPARYKTVAEHIGNTAHNRARVFAKRLGRTCREQGSNTDIVQLRGTRSGRFNNKLIILKNALELVTTLDPPHRLLVSPEKWPGLAEMLDIFDLVGATQSWTCLLMDTPRENQGKRNVYLVDVYLAINLHHNVAQAPGAIAAARLFYEGFMAQVLLRPVLPLRQYVEALERRLGLDRQEHYVGVHFRQLEGNNKQTIPRLGKARYVDDSHHIIVLNDITITYRRLPQEEHAANLRRSAAAGAPAGRPQPDSGRRVPPER